MLRRLISFSAIALMLVAPQLLRAQERWQNLEQLKSGQKITVIDHRMKNYTGLFVRVTSDSLSLRVKGEEISLDRDSVYRVTAGGGHRGRNAVIGLLAGAAVGGAMTATLEHESGYGAAVAGSIGGFGAIGAGVGALTGGPKTIYRAERPKGVTSSTAAD